jgi:glucokinase
LTRYDLDSSISNFSYPITQLPNAMILAGDVGATKTLLGLFDGGSPRPRPLSVQTFETNKYDGPATVIKAFLAEAASSQTIEAACFGVAGPVEKGAAQLTNAPWRVDAADLARTFGITRFALLNDLEAMAYAVPHFAPDEVHVLQEGSPVAGGSMALIAAGTGLGEAVLHQIDGRFIASPTEAGHADFAARNDGEVVVLRDLVRRYGRAEVEQVLSGPGLVNLHRVMHEGPCRAIESEADRDKPAAITRAALEHRCSGCVEALRLFVEAYGAEAGNLALRSVATGGVFIGGGIAPKILPALTEGGFMRAFRDKAPLAELMTTISVRVILFPEPGLLGAAIYASAPMTKL